MTKKEFESIVRGCAIHTGAESVDELLEIGCVVDKLRLLLYIYTHRRDEEKFYWINEKDVSDRLSLFEDEIDKVLDFLNDEIDLDDDEND